MMSNPIRRWFIKRLSSFGYAWNGLQLAFQSEVNMRIHLSLAIIAITLGFLLQITATEWTMVVLAIGLVISIECLNTAIEYMCDAIEPHESKLIGHAKDIAAAAVLVAAITALMIGLIVFAPKLLQLLRLF